MCGNSQRIAKDRRLEMGTVAFGASEDPRLDLTSGSPVNPSRGHGRGGGRHRAPAQRDRSPHGEVLGAWAGESCKAEGRCLPNAC